MPDINICVACSAEVCHLSHSHQRSGLGDAHAPAKGPGAVVSDFHGGCDSDLICHGDYFCTSLATHAPEHTSKATGGVKELPFYITANFRILWFIHVFESCNSCGQDHSVAVIAALKSNQIYTRPPFSRGCLICKLMPTEKSKLAW